MSDPYDPRCRTGCGHRSIAWNLCVECLDHAPRCPECEAPLYKGMCPTDCLARRQRLSELCERLKANPPDRPTLPWPETPDEQRDEHESVSLFRW